MSRNSLIRKIQYAVTVLVGFVFLLAPSFLFRDSGFLKNGNVAHADVPAPPEPSSGDGGGCGSCEGCGGAGGCCGE